MHTERPELFAEWFKNTVVIDGQPIILWYERIGYMARLCYSCNNYKGKRLIKECTECFLPDLYPIDPNGCLLCTKPHDGDGGYCYSCNTGFHFGDFRLNDLIPITYNTGTDRLTSFLVAFKNGNYSDRLIGIVSVLIWFLFYNHKKIRDRHGHINYITYVPGWKGRDHNKEILDTANKCVRLFFPYKELLTQVKEVPKRQGASRAERTLLKDAYSVLPNRNVNGKNIILFDDFFTTGSTLSSAAHSLYEHGAEKVIGLVLLRRVSGDFELSRVHELKAQSQFNYKQCKYDFYK